MGTSIIRPLKRFAKTFREARDSNLNEADTVLRLCRFFEEVLGYDGLRDISREAEMKNKFVVGPAGETAALSASERAARQRGVGRARSGSQPSTGFMDCGGELFQGCCRARDGVALLPSGGVTLLLRGGRRQR